MYSSNEKESLFGRIGNQFGLSGLRDSLGRYRERAEVSDSKILKLGASLIDTMDRVSKSYNDNSKRRSEQDDFLEYISLFDPGFELKQFLKVVRDDFFPVFIRAWYKFDKHLLDEYYTPEYREQAEMQLDIFRKREINSPSIHRLPDSVEVVEMKDDSSINRRVLVVKLEYSRSTPSRLDMRMERAKNKNVSASDAPSVTKEGDMEVQQLTEGDSRKEGEAPEGEKKEEKKKRVDREFGFSSLQDKRTSFGAAMMGMSSGTNFINATAIFTFAFHEDVRVFKLASFEEQLGAGVYV